MRGKMNAVTADMLTAELRKRLAETNNLVDASPAAHVPDGCELGARAVRLARVATAMHLATAANGMKNTGETPVLPVQGNGTP